MDKSTLSRGYTCDFLLAQVSRRQRTVVATRVANSGDKMLQLDRVKPGPVLVLKFYWLDILWSRRKSQQAGYTINKVRDLVMK